MHYAKQKKKNKRNNKNSNQTIDNNKTVATAQSYFLICAFAYKTTEMNEKERDVARSSQIDCFSTSMCIFLTQIAMHSFDSQRARVCVCFRVNECKIRILLHRSYLAGICSK